MDEQWHYLCKRKAKKQIVEQAPSSRGAQNTNIMDTQKQIENLRYSLKRYQEMGNGAMCQRLSAELLRLQGQAQGARRS